MSPSIFLDYAAVTAIWVMTISLFFPMYRLFRGPTLPDRVVALDQISVIFVALIICDVIYSKNVRLLDVALIVSFLLAFGSLIIVRYLYKQNSQND
jgi:multicomponent Na+:H+ antiporter subunit F